MKKSKSIKNKAPIVFFPFLFLLCSCFGVNADIVLNQNGTGTIELEYRISNSLDSLGRLDGNERWNTIPVGRADFERTLDRLPGMKLISFSSRDEGKNLVNRAKMEFDNIQALLTFLDAGGRRAAFSGNEKSGSIVLTLNEGSEVKNQSLHALVKDISESYFVRVSMTFPAEGSLVITNNKDMPLPAVPQGEISARGKKVFFSFPLYEVLSSTDGIYATFRW